MNLTETILILVLVIDPFGNIPVVLAVLRDLDNRTYARAIAREVAIAFVLLLVFALAGQQLLDYLGLDRASLSVAGGVILFLISLKMIFGGSARMMDEDYDADPVIVPIAVPLIAGPSAITTIIVLNTRDQIALPLLLLALALVSLLCLVALIAGRRLHAWLRPRGINAMEKLMGLLLNLVAVDMILHGIRTFMTQTL
jgi:multiple antibiotic resistance protein